MEVSFYLAPPAFDSGEWKFLLSRAAGFRFGVCLCSDMLEVRMLFSSSGLVSIVMDEISMVLKLSDDCAKELKAEKVWGGQVSGVCVARDEILKQFR